MGGLRKMENRRKKRGNGEKKREEKGRDRPRIDVSSRDNYHHPLI